MRITNWYVITGSPCSGKTSVILQLEQLGYKVVHEVARSYIDGELSKGKTLDEIKTDVSSFEHNIMYKKIEIESALPDKVITFLDRAVPDSIAYFRFAGLNTEEPEKRSAEIRYRKIFLFERLQIHHDGVRNEDDEGSALIDELIEDTYINLGYKIIRVPILPVNERTGFILENL